MVRIICLLVLIKLGLINNHLVLLISNIVSFFKHIKSNQNQSVIFLYAFLFSFISLSNLLEYLIILKIKYLHLAEGIYIC